MKKIKLLRTLTLSLIVSSSIITLISVNGCAPAKAVAAKSGVQLWSENCQRCHNTPSPASFSAEQWETIGLHMQSRALLTENEKDKIVKFLKTAQ